MSKKSNVDAYFELRRARIHYKMMRRVLETADMPISKVKKTPMRGKYHFYKKKLDAAVGKLTLAENRWMKVIDKLTVPQRRQLEQDILADPREKM